MRYLLEITQEEKDMLQRVVSRECRRARNAGDGEALRLAVGLVVQLGGEVIPKEVATRPKKKRSLSDEDRARRAEHMRRIRVNGAQKRDPMVEIRGSVTATTT